MSCPPNLSRAISDGASPELEEHIAGCDHCAKEWAATHRMLELAREMAAPLPSAAHRETVRAAMLAASRTTDLSTEPRSPRRFDRRLTIGAFAAVAAGVVVYVATRPAPPTVSHLHATVNALAGASYFAASTTPDEIVQLFDGSIDVQVSPLHRGERFRVILADAEIEVHGTQFIATAERGALVGVVVAHGVVEVRPRGGTPTLLHAGDAWRVPAPARIAPLVGPVLPEPPPVVVTVPAPKLVRVIAPKPVRADPIESLPQERAYDDGWAAMRTGSFDIAATAFSRVTLLDPTGPLAEDATYWAAVALARGKQTARAVTAFRDFIELYPRSRRNGEASTMLGWILVVQHERAEAERLFRTAITDADPAVRTSAQAGLDAIVN